MRVTIDANVLIWGVRATSSRGDEEMIPRCKRFLEWLDECGHELALTSQAVTEYLIGATTEERFRELSELSAKYIILPYDASGIEKAAELRSDKDFIRSLGDDALKTRNCVKADVVIVASAIAGDCLRIYSRDTGLRSMADRVGLASSDIPSLAEMEPLGGKPKPDHGPAKPRNATPSLFDSEDSPTDT